MANIQSTKNKDISIGKDEWIKWIEFDTQNSDFFDLDSLLESTKGLWKALETECVFGCCGIDALGLWTDDIKTATKEMDKAVLEKDIINLKQELSLIENNILISSFLNQLIDKTVFIQILNHIQNNLK